MHAYFVSAEPGTSWGWLIGVLAVLVARFGWIIGQAALLCAVCLRKTRNAAAGVLIVLLLSAGSLLIALSLALQVGLAGLRSERSSAAVETRRPSQAQ